MPVGKTNNGAAPSPRTASYSLRRIARELGKYAGRVVADVTLEDGRSLADILITADLARPYDGGTREGWCQDDGD